MSSDAGAGSGPGAGTLAREPVGPDQGALAGLVGTMYEDVDAITALREEIFLQSEETPDLGVLVAFLASWDIAWQELATTRPEVIDAITRLTDEELNSVGLAGAQLAMKLSAWRRVRARMIAEFDDGTPAPAPVRRLPEDDAPPTGVQVEERSMPLNRPNIFKRACRAISSALGVGDTVLGSLVRISGQAERFKEGKEIIERLAGDVADAE